MQSSSANFPSPEQFQLGGTPYEAVSFGNGFPDTGLPDSNELSFTKQARNTLPADDEDEFQINRIL
mgnify:CR=1 FL=1